MKQPSLRIASLFCYSSKKENGLVTVSLSTYNENEEIVFKGEVTALINNS
ncbi:hypothetical protein [Staphylococcus aureus]|nr:hypothetical protein [Staphylococcus aureus]MCE7844725.1 hypothetical protein [Staphylococcus aureus]